MAVLSQRYFFIEMCHGIHNVRRLTFLPKTPGFSSWSITYTQLWLHALPPSNASMFISVNRSVQATTLENGAISRKCRFNALTLYCPISSTFATACWAIFFRVRRFGSMIRKCCTPERSSINAAHDPTLPAPTTTTSDWRTFWTPCSPRNAILRANCSWIKLSSKSTCCAPVLRLSLLAAIVPSGVSSAWCSVCASCNSWSFNALDRFRRWLAWYVRIADAVAADAAAAVNVNRTACWCFSTNWKVESTTRSAVEAIVIGQKSIQGVLSQEKTMQTSSTPLAMTTANSPSRHTHCAVKTFFVYSNGVNIYQCIGSKGLEYG